MNTLSNTNDSLLAWVEVTPRHFELQADNEVVATLRWPKPLRSVALGDSPSGLFIFKRLHNLGLQIRVRDADSRADVGVLGKAAGKPNLFALASGENFYLQALDDDGLAVHDQNGEVVMTLRNDCYSSPCAIRVTRGPRWQNSPTITLLAMVGLYVLELQANEAMTATLVATTLLNAG